MDVHNFQLNNVFQQNAKEYVTRPVKAMKYKLGVENGFCVHYSSTEVYTREYMMYEGIRFFPSEADAWKFINRNEKQYAMENGKFIEIEVIYDEPEPVLYRKDANAEELDGIHFDFGKHAFISDESEKYEFYILEAGCWIIQDINGNIRIWHPESEESFFGKEYVCERMIDVDNYIQVAV